MLSSVAPMFDLVIFDCDGVLIDSEDLSAEVLSALLAEHGVVLDAEGFRSDFLGRSFAAASERLTARTGKVLPPVFHDHYQVRLLQTFTERLQPMAGVETVVSQLTTRMCVASSSNPKRLAHALACTGLDGVFGDHVFSGSMVRNAKPAPDLFLFAAQKLGVEPQRCLVIEDSEMGLLAARAAGMHVWYFRGGSHLRGHRNRADTAPHDALAEDMSQLLDMLMAAGLCKPYKGQT